MKKIMIVALVLAACITAGNAFAATCADATAIATQAISTIPGATLCATAPATSSISKMSTNVLMGATYSGTGYAIDTYHTSGTKAYGTAFDSTALYFSDLGINGTLTAPTSSLGEDAFGTWTKM